MGIRRNQSRNEHEKLCCGVADTRQLRPAGGEEKNTQVGTGKKLNKGEKADSRKSPPYSRKIILPGRREHVY